MKQKDIALIAAVIAASAILSFVATKALFGGQKGKLQAEVVQAITTTFPDADKRYFNNDSINPVKLITIQKNNNNDPFNGSNSK